MDETSPRRPPQAFDVPQALKLCPWCSGKLGFVAAYPVAALTPFQIAEPPPAINVPPELRSTRAWVCLTPHCRYRERG
jgi:hypothetical protein